MTVHVTAKFECSTSFTPLKEEICAEVLVDDKKLWNTLCGLKMQTELTPLLSVDDISLRKEIGRGSYDYSIETYHNLNSFHFFPSLLIDLFLCEKIIDSGKCTKDCSKEKKLRLSNIPDSQK